MALAFESLAREWSGIELLNVRHEDGVTQATVFVPDGKLDLFEKHIIAYLERRKDGLGHARDHRRLLDAIRQIRTAGLQALWTDASEAFPTAEDAPVWWEVWLPVRKDRHATTAAFRERASGQCMHLATGELRFPERTVLLARASVEQMRASIVMLNSIAELRQAKETAEFFDSRPAKVQAKLLDDLAARTRYASEAEDVPHVCLLDTGVNRGRRFLAPALATADLHAVEPG